ncbi:MAG TPA: hypothetical protein VG406_24610 [Isosphaeraceae bacterium]|nr:hypothetical protein [Isosphaeraceae bacterium]
MHTELVLEHELAWLNRVLAYHKMLKAKYDALAAQPWLSVDPDPPGPVRSVRQEEDEIERDTEARWRRHLASVRRRSKLVGR